MTETRRERQLWRQSVKRLAGSGGEGRPMRRSFLGVVGLRLGLGPEAHSDRQSVPIAHRDPEPNVPAGIERHIETEVEGETEVQVVPISIVRPIVSEMRIKHNPWG